MVNIPKLLDKKVKMPMNIIQKAILCNWALLIAQYLDSENYRYKVLRFGMVSSHNCILVPF